MTTNSTSITVHGLTRRLLGELTDRERGLWVSRLLEHRPPPKKIDEGPRTGVVRVTIRVSNLALHNMRAVPNASRLVDAHIAEAWDRVLAIVDALSLRGIGRAHLAAAWSMIHRLKPTTPTAVYHAAMFASIEPTMGLAESVREALVDSDVALQLLALALILPPGTERLLTIARDELDDQRAARSA